MIRRWKKTSPVAAIAAIILMGGLTLCMIFYFRSVLEPEKKARPAVANLQKPSAQKVAEAPAPALPSPPRPLFGVSGRIVRPGGTEPAPNVSIRLRVSPDRTDSVATGADGRFELAAVPSGTPLRIEIDEAASALRVLAWTIDPTSAGPSMDLGDIPLEPPSVLKVKLTSMENLPFERAELSISRSGVPGLEGLEKLGGREERREMVKLEKGESIIERLPPGKHRLEVRAKGHAFREVSASIPRQAPLVIQLVAGSKISGTVRDSAGKPVAGAEVSAFETEGSQPFNAQTDAAGAFTIDFLLPKTWLMEAQAAGYAVESAGDVPAGRDNLVIVLQRAGAISGKVLFDGNEKPVEGAKVLAEPFISPGCRNAQTDAAGRFDLASVHPGTYFLGAVGDGLVPAGAPLEVTVGEGEKVEAPPIYLKGGIEVSRQVVDAVTQEPIPDAQVDFDLAPYETKP